MSEYMDFDVWRLIPDIVPIKDLYDEEEDGDNGELQIQEIGLDDINALSSGDKAYPCWDPWAHGQLAMPSQLDYQTFKDKCCSWGWRLCP